jgi:hypothetical protein
LPIYRLKAYISLNLSISLEHTAIERLQKLFKNTISRRRD